ALVGAAHGGAGLGVGLRGERGRGLRPEEAARVLAVHRRLAQEPEQHVAVALVGPLLVAQRAERLVAEGGRASHVPSWYHHGTYGFAWDHTSWGTPPRSPNTNASWPKS